MGAGLEAVAVAGVEVVVEVMSKLRAAAGFRGIEGADEATGGAAP